MMETETFAVSEPYLKLQCELGEGPHYEESTGILRFVDIIRKEMHTVSLKEGPESHRVAKLEDSVGITADIEGRSGEYIVAAKRGFALYSKETGHLVYLKKVYEDDPELEERMRFNDGAVDSRGRFWAGSMNDFHVQQLQPEGCVFRLDPDMTLHRMIESVSIPNGIGWSLDDKTMYFTDSPSRGIFAYDYDADTGAITNKRFFFKLRDDEEGVLDGCTIDSKGNVWAAVHEGSRVIKISPQGEVIAQVNLPAWRPTCPVFGGLNLDELFITTMGVEDGSEPPAGSKGHGSLFRIKTEARGMKPNKFGEF